MRLDSVRESLTASLASPTLIAAFARGRSRQEALALFDLPVDVVEFLNTRDLDACARRSAVTAALIAEAQRGAESCWATILLVAYFPGLLRIRGALKPAAYLDHDEVSALILESFMEVVGTLPLDTQGRHAVINLVFSTRKRVMQQLRSDAARLRRERPLRSQEEDLLSSEPYPSAEQLTLVVEAERLLQPERFAEWVRELSGAANEDDVLLVLGTYASGKPLVEWLHERRPNIGPRDLLLEYRRLRQRRARMLTQLRRRLRSAAMSDQRARVALLVHGLEQTSSQEARP